MPGFQKKESYVNQKELTEVSWLFNHPPRRETNAQEIQRPNFAP